MTGDATISLRPVVRWPRLVQPRTRYLVTVDLTVDEGQPWPYEDSEEHTIGCVLDGAPWCEVESAGSDLLVVHRMGGTYGPVRFILHIGDLTVRPGPLHLTYLTAGGMPFRTVRLDVGRAEPDHAASIDASLPAIQTDLPRQARRTIHAVVVGADDVGAGAPVLRGAVNDAFAVRDMLTGVLSASATLHVRVLTGPEATREAVIAALEEMAANAGPGDSALFWFSGHGSSVETPADLWHLTPSGRLSSLICYSPGDDRANLVETELTGLLAEVADNGAHTVAVLDTSNAGGQVLSRWVAQSATVIESEALRQSRVAQPRSNQPIVTLSACQSLQGAQEATLNGRVQGLFSFALLRALARLGPSATYRELMVAARCEVEMRTLGQTPVIYPNNDPIIDQPFLGGPIIAPESPIVMRYGREGWEIDAGSCHGLPSVGRVRISVPRLGPDHESAVEQVFATHSLVRPIGWEPDPGMQYRVALSELPTEPIKVLIDAEGQAVSEALTASRSPLVREVSPGQGPDFRVYVRDGRASVLQWQDESPIIAPIVVDESGTREVVGTLEHIARWRSVYALQNPVSRLTGAVRIEVVPARPAERRVSADAPALEPRDGIISLQAARTAQGWEPLTFFIRLHNRSDRALYCVLLTLTSSYQIDAALFPGDFIAPGRKAAALQGGLIRAFPPAGVQPRPGLIVRDWLKLIVADEPFSAEPFRMPALGRQRATARDASRDVPRPILSRIVDWSAQEHSIVQSLEGGAADWDTTMLPLAVRYE